MEKAIKPLFQSLAVGRINHSTKVVLPTNDQNTNQQSKYQLPLSSWKMFKIPKRGIQNTNGQVQNTKKYTNFWYYEPWYFERKYFELDPAALNRLILNNWYTINATQKYIYLCVSWFLCPFVVIIRCRFFETGGLLCAVALGFLVRDDWRLLQVAMALQW